MALSGIKKIWFCCSKKSVWACHYGKWFYLSRMPEPCWSSGYISFHMSNRSLRVKLNSLAITKFGLGVSQSRQCKKHLKHITWTLGQEAEKDVVCSMFPQRNVVSIFTGDLLCQTDKVGCSRTVSGPLCVSRLSMHPWRCCRCISASGTTF